MKPTVKKVLSAVLTVAAVILLTGCLSITADELYSLPQASEEYLKLQRNINSVLNAGAEFSPPTGGPNRQSVQLTDLNGNGNNEAIAFFSVPGDSTLKIYIFEMTEDDYTVAEVIEGVGTAIESIRYIDMDGDGMMELVVGWQMGAALKHMSVYTLKDFLNVKIASADYTALSVYDINADGCDDVIALRLPTQESGAVAELFTLMRDGEMVSSEARLSNSVEAILRVITGKLSNGIPAVFVESEYEGYVVTDICAYLSGSFTNVTAKVSGGMSEETVRPGGALSRIYSTDINRDGVMEIPIPRLLKAQSETAYYAIDWYAFNSRGVSTLALTTYHNYVDEWYLILPFDWRGKVSVRREDAVSGERTVIFSYIEGDEGPYRDFLKVYKLSGDNREERARMPGRSILLSEGVSIYAYELLAEPNSYGLSYDGMLIRDNFKLIYSD